MKKCHDYFGFANSQAGLRHSQVEGKEHIEEPPVFAGL